MKLLRVMLSVAAFLVFDAAAQQAPHAKKLIEYGWDVPQPAYIRANIREMEKKPFDGLIFRLPGRMPNYVLDVS